MFSLTACSSSRRPTPPSLERVVMACLEKDPTARPATALDLAAQLSACGVEPWTAEDARAWWEEHMADLQREEATAEVARSEQPTALLRPMA